MNHETKLTANGWTEDYIGIFTHPLFDKSFDTNSGGIAVLDFDGTMTDYIGEDSSKLDKVLFVKYHTHVDFHNDLPI